MASKAFGMSGIRSERIEALSTTSVPGLEVIDATGRSPEPAVPRRSASRCGARLDADKEGGFFFPGVMPDGAYWWE
jgi:hypothetical protein